MVRLLQVCHLPHVTPVYIQVQAKRLHMEKRYLAGLLLHVVESNDPIPNEERDEQEDRDRYVRGKYAAFIEC